MLLQSLLGPWFVLVAPMLQLAPAYPNACLAPALPLPLPSLPPLMLPLPLPVAQLGALGSSRSGSGRSTLVRSARLSVALLWQFGAASTCLH